MIDFNSVEFRPGNPGNPGRDVSETRNLKNFVKKLRVALTLHYKYLLLFVFAGLSGQSGKIPSFSFD